MFTVKEALAVAVEIVSGQGPGLFISASEYRQAGGMVEMQFCLQLGNGGRRACRLIEAESFSGDPEATWEQALDKLRAEHVAVVESMRAETLEAAS
jgi:hypothetical protein